MPGEEQRKPAGGNVSLDALAIQGDHTQVGGQRSYILVDGQPVDVVQAAIEATRRGDRVGQLVRDCDPASLGVHASIAVGDQATESLTAYLSRAHDEELRTLLAQLQVAEATSRILLVVGSSCSGKSRALFEAVVGTLPAWRLVAPRTVQDILDCLRAGLPAQTVVWLDEAQDRRPRAAGARAAEQLRLLITSTESGAGPILIAGTTWETNLNAMRARPSPHEALEGAGAIPMLIDLASVVGVGTTFTSNERRLAEKSPDARLRAAAVASGQSRGCDPGWQVTQVLAGGKALVDRMYASAHPERFSPIAKAVLFAAAELRRLGMPNPIPRWAIEGVAPSLLNGDDGRPPALWLSRAIDEVAEDADRSDPLVGANDLDIHGRGVPALTPQWVEESGGQRIPAYVLHDYLLQEHHRRRRFWEPEPAVWSVLQSDANRLRPEIALVLGTRAAEFERKEVALALLSRAALVRDDKSKRRLAEALGDLDAKAPLRQLATKNVHARSESARLAARSGSPERLFALAVGKYRRRNCSHELCPDALSALASPSNVRTFLDLFDEKDQRPIAWLKGHVAPLPLERHDLLQMVSGGDPLQLKPRLENWQRLMDHASTQAKARRERGSNE